jgi:hypothetical protein
MSAPEAIAKMVLDQLHINSADDLRLLSKIVYARGAILRESLLEGAEACLLAGAGKPIITVSSSLFGNQHRRRFSIGHELGHLEMHRKTGFLISCTKGDIQDKAEKAGPPIEQEANFFASAFLLPARFIQKPFTESEPSFDLIAEWANVLDMSLTSTAFRFLRFTPEPVAVVYSVQGVIQYFQPSAEFADLCLFPDVNGPVGDSTDAWALFTGKKPRGKWHEVRASEWFRENNEVFDSADKIKEWSIPMTSYEAVLSLLWVDEPLGEDSDW